MRPPAGMLMLPARRPCCGGEWGVLFLSPGHLPWGRASSFSSCWLKRWGGVKEPREEPLSCDVKHTFQFKPIFFVLVAVILYFGRCAVLSGHYTVPNPRGDTTRQGWAGSTVITGHKVRCWVGRLPFRQSAKVVCFPLLCTAVSTTVLLSVPATASRLP